MRELPKICNRIKQDLYNLYKHVQDNVDVNIDNVNASLDDYGLKATNLSWIELAKSGSLITYIRSQGVSLKAGDKIKVIAKGVSSFSNGRIQLRNESSSGTTIAYVATDVLEYTITENGTYFFVLRNDNGFQLPYNSYTALYINNQIDKVMAALTPKLITDITPYDNRCTINSNSSFIEGNTVHLALVVTVNETIPTSSKWLLQSLPKPKVDGSVVMANNGHCIITSTRGCPLYPITEVPSGSKIIISGDYIAE